MVVKGIEPLKTGRLSASPTGSVRTRTMSKRALQARSLPDNTCARWRACLPAERTQTSHDPDLELLAALVVILHRSSLLPWDKFKAIMDTAGRHGLMNKLAVTADYRTTMAYFTRGQQDPAVNVRAAPLGEPSKFPVHEAAELAAPTAVGPGYSREKALEAIRARYESCAAVTR